jgi:hypothetical protein
MGIDATGRIKETGKADKDHERRRKENHYEFERIIQMVGPDEDVDPCYEQEKGDYADRQGLEP